MEPVPAAEQPAPAAEPPAPASEPLVRADEPPRAARSASGRGTRARAPYGGVDVTPADPRDGGGPQRKLATIEPDGLCVTKGKLAGARIKVPTFRAVANGASGDAAAATFLVHGATAEARALASGQQRRQLGLKLRAQDGCNLVYVMWRLDPKPKLEVSVKHNPGARTAKECGANGYAKVKPQRTEVLPALIDGNQHELRAEIRGDQLLAWVDDRLVWEGSLPAAAAALAGPAGLRSDNLEFELSALSFGGAGGDTARRDKQACKGDEQSD